MSENKLGFWVVLENAEGRIIKSWRVDTTEGIPFGARLRILVDEPIKNMNEEVSK